MPTIPYTLASREDGGESLTVFFPERGPAVLSDDHPNFRELIDRLREQAEGAVLTTRDALDLADLAEAVRRVFRHLSERVSVSGGSVFFDGDEVHSSITKHILRSLDEGTDSYVPYVRFLDKLARNPQQHSREQLYEWLDRHSFTITQEGDFVAYKGVARTEDGKFQSLNGGRAAVNGVEQTGRITQDVGDVVTMPRSAVQHDPATGCSTGLHAGTYEYAKGYASNGALLRVHVDPQDVVSVPTDSYAQKLRVSRYRIVDTIQAPVEYAVEPDDLSDDRYYEDEEADEADTCWFCGVELDEDGVCPSTY
jgi:hypothetical protein